MQPLHHLLQACYRQSSELLHLSLYLTHTSFTVNLIRTVTDISTPVSQQVYTRPLNQPTRDQQHLRPTPIPIPIISFGANNTVSSALPYRWLGLSNNTVSSPWFGLSSNTVSSALPYRWLGLSNNTVSSPWFGLSNNTVSSALPHR